MGSFNFIAFVVPKACKDIEYWFDRKCCEVKQAGTIERLVEQEWFFWCYWELSMMVINQVDGIFSLKFIIQNYLEIQRLLLS